LESFLEAILGISADASDPLNQKLALTFLTKFVSLFGYATPPADPAAANGVIIVPGVEQFLYQRMLVVAFGIPFSPDFNVKDGQASAVRNKVPLLYIASTHLELHPHSTNLRLSTRSAILSRPSPKCVETKH
jgi:exportin-T